MRTRDVSYTEETEYEQSRRKYKVSTLALIIMLILAVLCLLVYWFGFHNKSDSYNSYSIIASANVTDGSRYMAYGDGYVRYTTDGAEAIRGQTPIWNVSYSMKKPVADTCGDYCVFADKGHQEVCITDGTGANYRIDIPAKIVDVCIASQGVVAVWTDSVDKDHIYLYDIKGNPLLDIATDIASNGFPLAFDLSDDGTKLVTSFIKIGDEMTTWVTFYNFGDVGQNYSDRMVGSYSFPGKLIPSVKFLNNERVGIFTEDGCVLYRMREIPEELATQEAPRLSAVCNSSEYVCLAEGETDGTTTLTIFDNNGKLQKKLLTGINYTGMYFGDRELIVHNNTSCIIYNMDGTEKFRTQIDGGIKSVFAAGGNKYYIVGSTEVREIELRSDGE